MHAPETGPNDSRTWPMFVFNYNGRVDCRVWLTGEIKGRGSKQTNEQEVSWLLVLSAMYYNMDIINASEDSKEHAVLNEMLAKDVYKRVYGANGKALDRAGAVGLATWLKKKPEWLKGHLAQCGKFIKGVDRAPAKFVKDRSNIPIVKRAKELFHTSVPDQKFDKDKWNPADVWLEYEEFVPDNYTTLDDINRYLKNSISSKGLGIIGISLKAGDGAPKAINLKGHIPNYKVTDFKLSYGEFLAQNVTTEYYGDELTGFSVMYRLFSASSSETIRGEASKKKSKAMHGKVFLKYINHLVGKGKQKIKSVEEVKGILVKQRKDGTYEWTGNGLKVFKKVKKFFAILSKDAHLFNYNTKGVGDKIDGVGTYVKLLSTRSTDQEFLNYLSSKEIERKGISETSMQTRISARFQTIVLGALFAIIKSKGVDNLYRIALGMLLYGKSESDWSAPHYKVE